VKESAFKGIPHMGVSRHSLDQLRAALNPLELFREAIPTLKQTGRRWKGLCPFHNERTPSFNVDPEKGLWHCFGGCQTGGDVFAFVMRREGLNFGDALRLLADRAGVRLEWEGGSEPDSREQKERDLLRELVEGASAFYHESLLSSAEGEAARRVLATRRVSPETVESFRLGYAADRGGYLEKCLKRGVQIEVLLKAGLAVRSSAGRFHDPMGGRLVFPITDPFGHVVGFGGRVLGDEKSGPKYLNSPETPLYNKSRQLYGLFQGRSSLRDRGQAVVVEGYMDVVGCHQASIRTAVAPLGTAFAREQAQLLKRYVKEVILLYDPDEAGLKASWRTAQVLLAEDLFVRVAQVPGDLDPDEYAAQKGPGALAAVVDRAQDVVDFWLDRLAASSDAYGGLHGRVRQAEELIRFVKGVPNALLQQEWLKKASLRLSLDEAALKREFEKGGGSFSPKPAGGSEQVPGTTSRPAPVSPAPKANALRMRTVEEEALQILCAHPSLWEGMALTEDLFIDPRCRAAFHALEDRRRGGSAVDPAALIQDLGETEARWWSALLMEEKRFDDPDEALARVIQGLKRQAREREWKGLGAEVQRMLAGAVPRDDVKIARYQTLTKDLKARAKG
jgi:DNA primase